MIQFQKAKQIVKMTKEIGNDDYFVASLKKKVKIEFLK